MFGFERASVLGDGTFMTCADKHLAMYVRLCEWVDSDKCLNSVGIKNSLTVSTLERTKQPSKDITYLNNSALQGVGQGVCVALKSYSVAIEGLACVLDRADRDIKAIVSATKACLNCLDHIIKCAKIIEYSVRVETASDIVSENKGDDMSDNGASYTNINSVDGACLVLENMGKEDARLYCEMSSNNESCSQAESQMLWSAYCQIFLSNSTADMTKPIVDEPPP